MNNKLDRRIEMREYRIRKRKENLLKKGKCPVCTMLLNKEYECYHKGCIYYETYINITARVHGFFDI
jgi:hypothetical protein